MEIKKSFMNVFEELFDKGEILKAQCLIHNCTPLDIKNDPQIVDTRENIDKHIETIKKWSTDGRPYPGTHVTVDFSLMPKFVLAKKHILDKYSNGKILDIGCYSGVFIEEMVKEGFESHGVDVHGELMRFLDDDNLNKNLRYIFGSSENLPLSDNDYDVVTAFDVLEHVIDFDKALSEIERVCKPDGLIIINLPRMTVGYKDESQEHMRMFDDEDINRIWGNKKDFKFEFCQDELGRATSFITYTK